MPSPLPGHSAQLPYQPSARRPFSERPRWPPSSQRSPELWPKPPNRPLLPLPSLPSLGLGLHPTPHLSLLLGNGLLGFACFVCSHCFPRGWFSFTPFPGNHRFSRGCSDGCCRDSYHCRDVGCLAFLPLGCLLLRDDDGSLNGGVLLRSPVQGNPEVTGHSAYALAGQSLLKGLFFRFLLCPLLGLGFIQPLTSASFLAMASWALRASCAATASRAAGSASRRSRATTASRAAAAMAAAVMATTAEMWVAWHSCHLAASSSAMTMAPLTVVFCSAALSRATKRLQGTPHTR